MEGQRTTRESNEAREREKECYKHLSLRKHGVSLSSHMWNCLSGQSDALTEINQSDITPAFVTAQHYPPSLFSSSLSVFSVSVLSRASCHCEYRHFYCSPYSRLPPSLSLTASLTPYLVVPPLIINATPLIRSISPPLSRPLTPTSFAREVRIKDGE